MINNQSDTIYSLSTTLHGSAIAIIRISGPKAIEIVQTFFKGRNLQSQKSQSLHFGQIVYQDAILDEVLVSVFRTPHSYTGEDLVEISCHASAYVVESIYAMCSTEGGRLALPGEFTMRAFASGKMDLSQAEAVADLIASESAAQHKLAMQQMKGTYSHQIEDLRQHLIDFAALLELELDFSEEDVQFADRSRFLELIHQAQQSLHRFIESFQTGNAIKKGIPVALAGKPNAGKSTLLNALLKEEKAIVSALPGTTRDFIEDTLTHQGILYRFIDTAGIRETHDELEIKGIERSFQQIDKAEIILYLADATQAFREIVSEFQAMSFAPERKVLIILTKMDLLENSCNAWDIEEAVSTLSQRPCLILSAHNEQLIQTLLDRISSFTLPTLNESNLIVTNTRHLEAFRNTLESLNLVEAGLHNGISTELIAIDLRMALDHMGKVTGKISHEDILSSIFSRFCIGK